MNILHHKSWHVRNKDNIQRVKRDEAKQAAEEKEKLRRKEIAESEARLDILRTKAGKKSKLVEYEDFLNQKNVNLFEEEELQKNKDDKNEEAEKEKAEEKEKFEKKVGLLKYLVDDEVLDLKNQPWYKTVKKSKKSNDDDEDDDLEIDLKRKHRLDPMTQVNELLKEKEKDKKKSEHKKHKKDHHKDKDEKPTTSKVKTIEQLRAERLKRESEERLKAQLLITGVKDDKKQESKVEADDRKRRYNNQFNPDFSKF